MLFLGEPDELNVRTKRAKKARASGNPLENEPNQRLDEPEIHAPMIPTGFLSPSVKEYLELGKSIPGRAGVDYPILSAVPYTNFYCDEQPYPGFFADVETRCQGLSSKIIIDVPRLFANISFLSLQDGIIAVIYQSNIQK